jgi:hypothetical protein
MPRAQRRNVSGIQSLTVRPPFHTVMTPRVRAYVPMKRDRVPSSRGGFCVMMVVDCSYYAARLRGRPAGGGSDVNRRR